MRRGGRERGEGGRERGEGVGREGRRRGEGREKKESFIPPSGMHHS